MPAPNGIYRLSVTGTVAGQQHVHTLHFRSTPAAAAVALAEDAYQQGIIDSWQAAPATAYRAQFGNPDSPVQFLSVRKVCGSLPLPAGVDETQAAGGILGSNGAAGQAMAPWLAHVVTVRSSFAGRSRRGRFFIGGLSEEQVTGSTLQSGRLTPAQGYIDALRTAYVTPDELTVAQKLFIFSRKLAAVAGIACQNAGADVTGFQLRDQMASMKSRKAGSGI